MEKQYVCIDLKSFFASVECVDRGLDPLTTNLVVADISRTEKTICLAVTPSLKSYGISGRARLFEVISRVSEVNARRKMHAPYHTFIGSSYNDPEIRHNPALSLDYITATPRMSRYIEMSTKVYEVYMKYVSPDDIHIYSIDEVFIDLTPYLHRAKMTAREFTANMIRDVYTTTGITATAGIGTNLYLAKVAMDIVAKRAEPNRYGVRMAALNELSYREKLWSHKPITDFWRVGHGYAKKLEQHGLYTMGDIALCSLGDENEYYNEGLLYSLFGVNAELLIDHAWGYEPCTIADIKAYRPASHSIGSGQVLHTPHTYDKARIILHEMLDSLSLELVDKEYVTDQIVLTIGYESIDIQSSSYHGEITIDRYKRNIPRHAHGTVNLRFFTSSAKMISDATLNLYDKIIDRSLMIRRINISACNLISEREASVMPSQWKQIDIFSDPYQEEKQERKEKKALQREHSMQKTMIDLKKRYGKNIILKGMNFEEGATARDRNAQIGGHKA